MPHERTVPALLWLFVLLTLCSYLINALTLWGLGRSDNPSWEPRLALLKNLILSDILQSSNSGPAVIYSLLQRRTVRLNSWCLVQYFLGSLTIFSSLVTITLMALERYLYVCHAIHYLVILTPVRMRVALLLIWVYATVVSAANLILLNMGQLHPHEEVTRGLLCEPDTVEQVMGFPRAAAVYRKITGSLTLLLCLLAYAFSYVRMYRDARNAVIPFNAANTTARKTVLFYCGMLFVQLLPVLIKVISDALWEVEGTAAMVELLPPSDKRGGTAPSATAAAMHVSLLVMLVVPPCINPLVFGLRNVEIRHVLLGRIRCL
uniref:G-protein coupled receptors family 1 profile domain-containing protein n=2 Tax=Periophthalmus magnuspinnatus TaxID=409849 RepID=A0A3B4B5M6_9GOBI